MFSHYSVKTDPAVRPLHAGITPVTCAIVSLESLPSGEPNGTVDYECFM